MKSKLFLLALSLLVRPVQAGPLTTLVQSSVQITFSDVFEKTPPYKRLLEELSTSHSAHQAASLIATRLALSYPEPRNAFRLRAFVGTLVRFDVVEQSAQMAYPLPGSAHRGALMEAYLGYRLLARRSAFKQALMMGWLLRYGQAQTRGETAPWHASFEARLKADHAQWKDSVERTFMFLHSYSDFPQEMHDGIESLRHKMQIAESASQERLSPFRQACVSLLRVMRSL